MCSVQYDACSMLELAGHSGLGQLTLTAQRNATVKRRRKSQAQSNPKKMFEEVRFEGVDLLEWRHFELI